MGPVAAHIEEPFDPTGPTGKNEAPENTAVSGPKSRRVDYEGLVEDSYGITRRARWVKNVDLN